MKIKKIKDDFGYIIKLQEKNIIFTISFGGNGDLYWQINNMDNEEDRLTYQPFLITKENMIVYELFEKLYNDIANCIVFEVCSIELNFCKTIEEIKKLHEKTKKLNEITKKSDNYNALFDGTNITWISDNRDYNNENLVKISKQEDSFLLEFYKIPKPKDFRLLDDDIYQIGIRFRNSGSFYSPFNNIFMKLYNSLYEYDLNNPQIHIEEYLYKKVIHK